MKKILIFGIAIIAILIGAGYVIFANSEYFEDLWGDSATSDLNGAWGQEIEITYADGSKGNIKVDIDNPTASYIIGDTPAVSFTYYLKAKATGTGYTSVDFQGADYQLICYTIKAGNKIRTIYKDGTWTGNIPIDGEWHTVLNPVTVTFDEMLSEELPYTYTMKLSPQGSISYKGNLDSSWSSVPLPSAISFDVELTEDNVLNIVFENGYSTS